MLYTYHTKEKKGNVISVFIQNYILSVTVRHIPSHYLLFNSVFKDLSTITNLFDRKIRFLSLSNVSYICFWYTKWHFFAFIHPNMLCYRYGAIVTWWNPKILKSAIICNLVWVTMVGIEPWTTVNVTRSLARSWRLTMCASQRQYWSISLHWRWRNDWQGHVISEGASITFDRA